jgi:hypothetical protein
LLHLLPTITIIKIVKETGTAGSSPLQVLDSNFDTWFAKGTAAPVPYTELINEVICNRMAQRWGFTQPEIAIATLSDDVITAFVAEGGSLSDHFFQTINHQPFFCSRQLQPAFELEPHIGVGTLQNDWQHLVDKTELYKIGYFDHWVCNQDRRPGGPNNILLYNALQGRRFVPFDHTAAFSQYGNYRDIPNANALILQPERSILRHPLCRQLLTFGTPIDFETLKNEVRSGIEASLQDLDAIFEQVPSVWGFSKKAKEHIQELLSDKARNKRIINLSPISI